MSKLVLSPHQCKFLDAQEPYVGLFGGMGNGKTLVACLKAIELSTAYPHNLGLVGRLTYRELSDSTQEMFLTQLRRFCAPDSWKLNKSDNSIEFWNKSKVIFRHLDEPANILSMNLGWFYIDQAEEIDEEVFLTLQGRLRRENIPNYKGMVTGNPKPLTWSYYKFGIDKVPDEVVAKDIKQIGYHTNIIGNYKMITAPTMANAKNLPGDYVANLQESYSPEWFDRFVNGAWGVFEGSIFDVTKIQGFQDLPTIRMVVSGVDPAISKSKAACNTAISTLGIGADGNIYDLETIAGKWSFLETLEQIKKLVTRQQPRFIAVEDTAYQAALVEACQSELSDHKEIMVENAKADRDKFRRAKAVSHIISKGLFRTNNKELMAEIAAFDADDKSSVRKDRVDAMVHALHMIQKYAPIRVTQKIDKKFASTFDYFWDKEVASFKENLGNTNQLNPDSNWAKNINDYY
jgi:predicted phage terminase large subunit-like protein